MLNNFIIVLTNKLSFMLEHGGYWILIVVTLLEGLPLIGTIIPGQTIVVLAGFFARLGVINPWMVVVIVALGAVLGDLLGYEIGKRYGMRFVEKFGPYVLIKPSHIDKAKSLINTHTGKSIVIGRFTAITRSLIPFIAGSTGVHKGKFWFYNFLGGFIWSVCSVAIGYVFGASYEVASKYLGRFSMIGVILAVLLILAYHYVNKNRHIFAKYQLTALFVSVVSALVFFRLTEDAISKWSFLTHMDVWVSRLALSAQNATGLTFSKLISDIFSPTTLAFGSVVLLLWALWRKYRFDALVIVVAYPVGTVAGYILKAVIARERPFLMLVSSHGFSFPSGHATAAAIFFSILIYLAFKYIRISIWREIAISACMLMAITVALARVYMNVHWLTDVIAGLALGAFVVAFTVLVLRYLEAMINRRKTSKNF